MPGIPASSLSARPWVDQLLRELLRRALPEIVRALEQNRLRAVLLSGSASLGEAVGWEDGPERRCLLSDLDLGAVTDRPVGAADRARLLRLLNSEENLRGLPEAAGRPLTLGFYETRRIDRQAPTPGLVDLRARGLLLWGEGGILERFRAPDPSRIPAWEAVRLVGNRALELLAAEGGGPANWRARARALHALAKAATGLWTASLVLQGRYRSGWRAREELLERATVGDAPAEVIAQARRWSRFMAEPASASAPEDALSEGNGLRGYRGALTAWLAVSPERFRPAGEPPEAAFLGEPPEAAFLGEPLSLRERLRAWRRSGPDGRSDLRRWILGRFQGTPDGCKMAAAALYWRCLPERPEPVWGAAIPLAPDPEALREWGHWTRTWLGREIPAGVGGRDRVRAELGLVREELREGV